MYIIPQPLPCTLHAQNGTPLNRAAAYGKTAAVHELIKLGAKKCVVAGMYGTPLHQAVLSGNLMTVEALLEDEVFERNLTKHDALPANAKITECGIINTCNSYGQTTVMWAIRCGRVEVFKLLTSKGGAISNRDAHVYIRALLCWWSCQQTEPVL